MSLQEKIQEQLKQTLNKAKKGYEREIIKDIAIVFASEDVNKISKFAEKLENIHLYVQEKFGDKKLPYKEKQQRIAEDKKALIKILESYDYGQKIPRSELAEKTGLSLRQLFGYTIGKNPVIKREGDYYIVQRILKKNPSENS